MAWFCLYWALFAGFAALETLAPARAAAPKRHSRWPTNIVLGVINASLAPIVPVSTIAAAQWAQHQGWGLINLATLPEFAAALAGFLGLSLAAYGIHVLFHKVPLLWRLHRVHHMDVDLDVTTSVRNHPVELLVNILAMTAAALVVGPPPWLTIGYTLVDQVAAPITHANIYLPGWADRLIRLVLVTPNIHCLHHSCHRPETDSNYGGVLTVWDRLFGTLNVEPVSGFDRLSIGVDEVRDDRAWNLWWQIASPVVRLNSSADDRDVYSGTDHAS